MWECPVGGKLCCETYCDYYIKNIKFGNCVFRVDRAMSFEEIAESTGMSIEEIKKITAMALQKIFNHLTMEQKIAKLKKQIKDVPG